jgi:hypothetical protein
MNTAGGKYYRRKKSLRDEEVKCYTIFSFVPRYYTFDN